MADPSSTVRIPIAIPLSLLAEIERWWHDHRQPSRAEAIRRLLEAGLKATAKETA